MRRGRSDLALTIAVGFALFSVLFCIGAVALIQPLRLTEHAMTKEALAVVLFASLLVPVLYSGLKVPRRP